VVVAAEEKPSKVTAWDSGVAAFLEHVEVTAAGSAEVVAGEGAKLVVDRLAVEGVEDAEESADD